MVTRRNLATRIHYAVMSIILNHEIHKPNLNSHLTNEMSAVCIPLKTTLKLKNEGLCNKSAAEYASLNSSGDTEAARTVETASYW
jgi:hypothetical protein